MPADPAAVKALFLEAAAVHDPDARARLLHERCGGDAALRERVAALLAAGGRAAENAIWSYPEPNEEASWLRGYAGFYWGAMDEWYDEDERVEGHFRDPYHRVDVRRSSRPVRVLLGEVVLAETTRPLLLSETGLPNRFYIPAADVRQDLLEESDTHTLCPYKGTASYWTVSAGDRKLADAVWSYPQAEGDSAAVSGYLSFLHDDLSIEVGQPG